MSAQPGFVRQHVFALGWGWIVFWIAVIIALEFTETPDWVRIPIVVICVIPTFIATVIVLKVTPRTHLEEHESILSHFLVRFATLFLAFLAWTVSIVVGASISSSIQLLTNNDERESLGTGFLLVAGVLPLVIDLLWAGLILRCVWFLSRLRGWRPYPPVTRVPTSMFTSRPVSRTVVIALAHPGMLLVGGLFSATIALLFAVYEPLELIIEAAL